MLTRLADNIGVNRVVLALSIARLGDAVGNSILFIVIPLYVAKLPAPFLPFPTPVLVGILLAVYGMVNSAIQPIMGSIADRLSRRKLLIQAGLVVMGLSTLSFTLASRFTDLLILRSLQGMGVAMTIPASMAILTTATQRKTRGGSMGVYSTMRIVGFAIGPLVGGYIFDHWGFKTTFYAGASAILVGLVAVQLWVHEKPIKVEIKTRTRSLFQIFDRDMLTTGILGVGFATFAMAAAFSMLTTLENEFNARLDMTAFTFSIAFSVLMLSRLVTQIPLGRLSDHIGRKPLIIGGLLLMAPATGLLGFVVNTVQLDGLRVLQGIASAGVAAPAFALAADLSTAGNEGRQLSIVTMGFGLGVALGPLLAGLLAAVSFTAPFIIGGIVCVIAGWYVFQFVPETIDRTHQHEPVADSSSNPSAAD